MSNYEIIIMALIFVIILLVTYKAVKSAFNFATAGTFTMSVCVSLLSAIGVARYLKSSLNVILLPYAAMEVVILVLLLLSFIRRYPAGAKGLFRHRSDKRKSLKGHKLSE